MASSPGVGQRDREPGAVVGRRRRLSDRTGWPGLFTFDVIADTRDMPYQAVLRRPTSLGSPLSASDAPYLLELFRRELGLKLAS